MKITLVGAGRAGTSLATALARVGHDVTLVHHDEVSTPMPPDVDLVVLCVPDDAIANVAAQLVPGEFVLAHLSGSRSLRELAPHRRVASLHPLAALPSATLGAQRLIGATYCVSGDPLAVTLVESLSGRVRHVDDENRTRYHATAAVAANHLVALMGHVEALAHAAGLELADFLPLAAQALDDVARVGPVDALTGPASRGDVATIDAHLAAIPEGERATYVAMVRVALELAERRRAQLSVT